MKPCIEYEWKHEFLPNLFLCGRIDRAEVGPVLFDLKTASEIGKTWHSDFRNLMLRDFGLALYDWYLCQIGYTPQTVKVECLVKPYKEKETHMEIFNLPEITQYRKRFEQQLSWICHEILHYHNHYGEQQPWPMAQGQCITKYGPCEYIDGCLHGWTAKTLTGYTIRQEHLMIKRVGKVDTIGRSISNPQTICRRPFNETS